MILVFGLMKPVKLLKWKWIHSKLFFPLFLFVVFSVSFLILHFVVVKYFSHRIFKTEEQGTEMRVLAEENLMENEIDLNEENENQKNEKIEKIFSNENENKNENENLNEEEQSDVDDQVELVDVMEEENLEIFETNKHPVQRMFIPMMVLTASSVAFAHGSNDIGKFNFFNLYFLFFIFYFILFCFVLFCFFKI